MEGSLYVESIWGRFFRSICSFVVNSVWYKLHMAGLVGAEQMQKITYAERRSGEDRRKSKRRGLKRFLTSFWRVSTYRRNWQRRTPYYRKETYTLYLSDRV